MRLVDIDEFENNTVSKFERNNNFEYRDMVKSIIFSIVQDLNKQPTAYNIDRVIEQLEKVSFVDVDKEYADDGQRMLFLHDAIEIVKKGGIEWKTESLVFTETYAMKYIN